MQICIYTFKQDNTVGIYSFKATIPHWKGLKVGISRRMIL